MVASRDEEGDFIEGIYNYCDRWCERCTMTERCFLYYKEQKRRAEHESKGEDPDDWDVVLKDVQTDLKEAVQMCRTVAEEQGVDLDFMMEEEEEAVEEGEEKGVDVDFEEEQPFSERVNISGYPLRIKAHQFAMDSHRFLEKFSNLIHEEERKGTARDQMADLQDCFETLSWYHMQIAVKIDRALSGKVRTNERKNMDVLQSDSDGSAKVAFIGMMKAMDALTKVYEWNQPLHNDIMPLLNVLYELVDEVDQEFPGYKTFKRPGFDD